MVFEVFGHYQHLQPVGYSAALIGSLQSSMSATSTCQTKNVQTQDVGTPSGNTQMKQQLAPLSAQSQVIIIWVYGNSDKISTGHANLNISNFMESINNLVSYFLPAI